MLGTARVLLQGIPTLVAESVNEVAAADTRIFSAAKFSGPEGAITLQAIGGFTAFNGIVQASLDGGTTWSDFTAFDFMASAVFIFNCSAGVIYRLYVSTITQTTPPNVWAVLA